MTPLRPHWWHVVSAVLGAGLGLMTIVVALAYVIQDTQNNVWAESSAAREIFGIGFLLTLGVVLVVTSLSDARELRAGLILGCSLMVFLNGLFAGGNLDPLGGLLGLPALAGLLAWGFALIESQRWRVAALYSIAFGAAGVAILRVSYAVASALGPFPGGR